MVFAIYYMWGVTHYYYHYLLRLIHCKQQGEGIDNSSVLVGSKVICLCVQVHVNLVSIRQTSGVVDTYLQN